jgi:hypothetical protein
MQAFNTHQYDRSHVFPDLGVRFHDGGKRCCATANVKKPIAGMPRMQAIDQFTDRRCQRGGDNRDRCKHDRRHRRREAPNRLCVEHRFQHHARDRERHRRDRDIRQREIAVPEQFERHQRLATDSRLLPNQCDKHDDPGSYRQPHAGDQS